MRGLAFLLLCGCAIMSRSAPPPAAPAQPPSAGEEPAPTPDERAFAADYQDAVALAEKGDLTGAYDLLAKRGAALQAQNHFAPAGIVWNTLTWVRWAQGDLPGALAENAKLGQAVPRAEDEARQDLYLHFLWDRAYLLRDQADKVPDAEKAGARAQADAARAEYG